MTTRENECVGCKEQGLPCIGFSCPNRLVRHLYCDKCKEDVEKLYIVDGEELCEACALKSFETIELED